MSTNEQKNGAAKSPKKRRWLWPVLIISLGLNLLFVGLVAGRIWNHGYGGHGGARGRIITAAIEKTTKKFAEAKRRRASELLKRHRATVGPLRSKIREARNAIKAAALAEPYSEEKFSQSLRRLREIRGGMHKSLHMTMMDLMKGLTLQERQELVKNIRSGFRHRRRGHWRGQNDAPGDTR